MMIAVPMELLGITNPLGIKFRFKWADSNSKMTTMEQFYTDGDAAPLGRLNYTFQNCLDPETAEQYVPSEQRTEAQSATDEVKPGGCKSTFAGLILLTCLVPVPFALYSKKKRK